MSLSPVMNDPVVPYSLRVSRLPRQLSSDNFGGCRLHPDAADWKLRGTNLPWRTDMRYSILALPALFLLVLGCSSSSAPAPAPAAALPEDHVKAAFVTLQQA